MNRSAYLLEPVSKPDFGEGEAPSDPKDTEIKLGRSLTLSVLKCSLVCCIVCLSLLIAVSETPGMQTAVSIGAGDADPAVVGQVASDAVAATVSPIASPSQMAPRTTLSNRLLLTGTLVVVLLGQLSVLFGYLKINHATRGFYSGRLQSFAAFASVAVFVIGSLFYMSWKT